MNKVTPLEHYVKNKTYPQEVLSFISEFLLASDAVSSPAFRIFIKSSYITLSKYKIIAEDTIFITKIRRSNNNKSNIRNPPYRPLKSKIYRILILFFKVSNAGLPLTKLVFYVKESQM